jgi:hypothetical protein
VQESREKPNSVNPVEDLKHWLEEHSENYKNCVNSDIRWDELTRRLDQLSDLIDVSKAVAAQLDLNSLLQQIVIIATRLVSAEFGGLLVFDQEDCCVQFFKTAGGISRLWVRRPHRVYWVWPTGRAHRFVWTTSHPIPRRSAFPQIPRKSAPFYPCR